MNPQYNIDWELLDVFFLTHKRLFPPTRVLQCVTCGTEQDIILADSFPICKNCYKDGELKTWAVKKIYQAAKKNLYPVNNIIMSEIKTSMVFSSKKEDYIDGIFYRIVIFSDTDNSPLYKKKDESDLSHLTIKKQESVLTDNVTLAEPFAFVRFFTSGCFDVKYHQTVNHFMNNEDYYLCQSAILEGRDRVREMFILAGDLEPESDPDPEDGLMEDLITIIRFPI